MQRSEATSEPPKVVRTPSFFYFDLEMCLAPQRGALFRHLNLQKRPEHAVFLTVCLRNVLRATTACTFSTSQLPKVVRTPSVFNTFSWKCASRHNGVHLFRHRHNGVHFFNISTSKSGPLLWCFVHFSLPNVLRATTACNSSSLS